MSGEVYAAAKASTCCDAVGEEYPNGAPRKIAVGNFVGSPGWRGSNTPMSGTCTLLTSEYYVPQRRRAMFFLRRVHSVAFVGAV